MIDNFMKTTEHWHNFDFRIRRQGGSFDDVVQAIQEDTLEFAAKKVCEGCREGWPIRSVDGEDMHVLPPDRIDPDPPYTTGTLSACEALFLEGRPRTGSIEREA